MSEPVDNGELVRPPTPERRPATENLHAEKPFIVFAPGIYAEGDQLTWLRENLGKINGAENNLVLSSVISKTGIKKGENLRRHYDNIASTIVERAGEKDVNFISHSLGVVETMDVVSALLENPNWKGKNIAVRFVSPIGFGRKGFGNITEVFGNSLKLKLKSDPFEQHVVYPLPEECYGEISPKSYPEDIKILFEDTSEKRAQRRETFKENLAKMVPDLNERGVYMAILQEIDRRILESLKDSNQSTEDIVVKRARLLQPFILDFFHGKHMPDELHQKYRREERESKEDLAVWWKQRALRLYYATRIAISLYAGMDKKLEKVFGKAKQKKVGFRFDFVFSENDLMVPVDKIEPVMASVAARDVSAMLEGAFILENCAHSSLALFPQVLEAVAKL